MKSWLDGKLIIGAWTRFGFLPVVCPNCKKEMNLNSAVLTFGHWRHEECHQHILEIRNRGEKTDERKQKY